MGLLSFSRYSVESVFRNRRRSLFAVIGIVIALSLLSGSWIAVDSSAKDLLRSRLDEVAIDFEGYSTQWALPVDQSYIDERVEATSNVKDIEKVEAFVRIGCQDFTNGSWSVDTDTMPDSRIMFIPESTSKLLEIANIEGTMPDLGTAAVPKSVSDELNLSIGESVTLLFVAYQSYYDEVSDTYLVNYSFQNVSIPISRIWTQGDSSEEWVSAGWGHPIEHPTEVRFAGDSSPIFMNLADLPFITSAVNQSVFTIDSWIPFYAWIDRDAVISLADLSQSVDRIQFINHRLNVAASEVGVTFYGSNLEYALGDVGPTLEGLKLLFAVLALPVIALGTYLSVVGVDLGVNERRREIGILKSRGSSNRQVFTSLLLESLILGAGSGLAGLVAGIAVSRGLVGVTEPLTSGEGHSLLGVLSVSPYTVLFSVVVGVLLMLASSYRPFKRMSKIDVAEALHHYSPSVAQIEYKPKWDAVSLLLVGLSTASILLGTGWVFDTGGSWIFQIVILVLFLVGVAIFPFVPFLLSLSVVRLLTRGSRKLYSKFTLIVKPWTGQLHHLVDRNIVRNPRRASNLCVIISLAMAFGLFISITVESSIEYEIAQVRYEVGSDVRIESSQYMRAAGSIDLGKVHTMGDVAGVKSSLPYYSMTFIQQGGYSQIVVFNASLYREVAKPSGFYFVDSGPSILDDLDQNGTILVTKQFANNRYILVGDRLASELVLERYANGSYLRESWEVTLTVAGIVKSLPGFPAYPYEAFIDSRTLSFIPELNMTIGSNWFGFMLDLEKGANASAVAESASDLLTEAGLAVSSVQILEEKVKALREDPGFTALSEYLYAEYAFSITIMTVGVGLLIFVAVSDREQELACIMARGSSGSQMRKILMGESLTLMVIGLLVGLSVGLLTAYTFNTLATDQMFGVVERKVVITFVSWAIVAGSVLSLLVASLLATARAGRIKLAEVLRVRGG